ncbi:MAG: hypothetical protein AB1306_00905 [Nitrospirota bacterium]
MRNSIFRALGLFVFLAVFVMLSACVFVPAGRHGAGVLVVPPLPAIVVLEEEPYYYHSGYYYYYNNDRWFYSHEKRGPWIDLPRGHYPKDIRYKGRGDEKGKGWKRRHDD